MLAAGRIDAAAEFCLEMAMREVEQAIGPSRFLSRLERVASQLQPAQQARLEALQDMTDWHADPPGTLTVLRRTLDTLIEAGEHAAPRLAMLLAELAAVAGGTDLLVELRATLLAMAEQAETTPELSDGEAVGVRIRLCIAEADGDFSALWRRANTGSGLQPAQAALIMARYGRWLAGNADPEPAEDAYWQAVGHATAAKLWGEAAEALRSLSTLHMRFPFPQSDFAEHLLRARTAAREGDSRYLPRRYDPRAAYAAGRTPQARSARHS